MKMSSILLKLPELYESYKNWLIKNPDKASDFETTAKWISYFVAGRINNSHILSELVYALSNLLVFFNDRVISRGMNLRGANDDSSKLKTWMTVLEYSEVFLELSAQQAWGNTGRWLIIIIIQLFKCIGRYILVQKHKEAITLSPPIPILDRLNVGEMERIENVDCNDASNQELESVSFTLKRSGKVIRKVDSAPPSSVRNWRPLQTHLQNEPTMDKALAGTQLYAEMLYIAKPIAHLCGCAIFGHNTWKPWMISLLLDMGSLHLYYKCMQVNHNALTKKQRLQISKRTILLIMYLLRSPFYDRHTKHRVEGFLNSLGKNVPLLGMVSQPLLSYLPFWQGTYFYMWST